MQRTALRVLALSILAAAPAVSQTTAGTTINVGCTAPAPTDSLVPVALGPEIWTAGDGIFVTEVEAIAPVASWTPKTTLSGFTGDSYFEWTGPDHHANPPGSPPLVYTFEVLVPGPYFIRIRNRHDNPVPDQENDCWLSVDGGPYEKVFNNFGEGSVGNWQWKVQYEHTGQEPKPTLDVGLHTIEIKGRSNGFKIDRIHVSAPGYPSAQSTGQQQSPLATDRPIIGTSFQVEIGDPTDAANLTPGSTFTLWTAGAPDASAPCGTVLPGFGVGGGNGELMLDLGGPFIALSGVGVWNGPGSPVTETLAVPNDVALVGNTFATQAVLADVSAGATTPIVVTDGLDLTIGDV